MANFTEEVTLKLKDEYSKGMAEISKQTGLLQAGLAKLGPIAAAALGGAAAISLIKSSINAYIEQEKAVVRLQGALKNQGITTKAAVENLTEFAQQLQRTTVFSDDAVISAERMLTQFGLTGDQLKKATIAATNMASALGIDLNTAALQIGKAFQGEMGTLGRYGIKIDETTLKAKGFDAVLSKIQQRFGGSAKAEADSYAGQLTKLEHSFDDLLKNLGQRFVELAQHTGILPKMNEWLDKLVDSTKVKDALGQVNDEISKTAKNMQFLQQQMKFHLDTTAGPKLEEEEKIMAELVKRQAELTGAKKADEAATISQTNAAKNRIAAEIAATKLAEENAKNQEKWSKERESLDEKYKNFHRTITKEATDGFEKVWYLYEEDSKRNKEYYDKDTDLARKTGKDKLISEKEYSDASMQIRNRMFNQTADMVVSTAKDIANLGNNSVDNMNKVIGSVKKFMPAQLQGFVTMFQGAISAVGSIFDIFGDDIRTGFQKMTDDIHKITTAAQAAISMLKDYKDDQARRAQKREGSVLGELGLDLKTDFDNNKASDRAKSILGGLANKFTAAGGYQEELGGLTYYTEGNSLIFLRGGDRKAVGIFDGDTGEWKIPNRFSGMSENNTLTILQQLFNLIKGKINLSAQGSPASPASSSSQGGAFTPRGYATGGVVSGPNGYDNINANLTAGEFVVSRRGVNKRTLGLLHAMNRGMEPSSQNIQIHVSAIDAASFEDFMKRDGLRVTRKLTAREGYRMVSSRGVSSNV